MEVLEISYNTALSMVRKVHGSVQGACNELKLDGIIEFDELYLSCGEKGNMDLKQPPRKRGLKLRGRGTMDKDKPPIIGACDRDGHIRLKVSKHADSMSIFLFFLSIIPLSPTIIMKILVGSLKVFTNDFSAYRFLYRIGIYHESVNHSAGEYVRGDVHNNTTLKFPIGNFIALKFHRNFKMEGYRSVFRHWILKFFKNFKILRES